MMSKTTVFLSKSVADSFVITYILFKKETFSVVCLTPMFYSSTLLDKHVSFLKVLLD